MKSSQVVPKPSPDIVEVMVEPKAILNHADYAGDEQDQLI